MYLLFKLHLNYGKYIVFFLLSILLQTVNVHAQSAFSLLGVRS